MLSAPDMLGSPGAEPACSLVAADAASAPRRPGKHAFVYLIATSRVSLN